MDVPLTSGLPFARRRVSENPILPRFSFIRLTDRFYMESSIIPAFPSYNFLTNLSFQSTFQQIDDLCQRWIYSILEFISPVAIALITDIINRQRWHESQVLDQWGKVLHDSTWFADPESVNSRTTEGQQVNNSQLLKIKWRCSNVNHWTLRITWGCNVYRWGYTMYIF